MLFFIASFCILLGLRFAQSQDINDCPSDITIYVGPRETTVKVNWTEPTLDGMRAISDTKKSGDSFDANLKELVRYVFFVDGIIETCEFTVLVVQDNAPPTITNCPRDIMALRYRQEWIEPTGEDPSGPVTDISNYSPGSIFPVGQTEVYYLFMDKFRNNASCIFVVTILEDTEAPVPNRCPKSVSLEISDKESMITSYVWTQPPAVDNSGYTTVTSEPSPGHDFPVGTTDVIITWSDDQGNIATCTFTVTVVSEEPAAIMNITVTNCPQSITTQLQGSQSTTTVTWSPPSAVNGTGFPLTGVSHHRPGDLFAAGTTTVKYEFNDGYGVRLCIFNVTVKTGLLNNDEAKDKLITASPISPVVLIGAGGGAILIIAVIIFSVALGCWRRSRKRPTANTPNVPSHVKPEGMDSYYEQTIADHSFQNPTNNSPEINNAKFSNVETYYEITDLHTTIYSN